MTRDDLSFMKEHCLKRLATGIVAIPEGWNTVLVYDALVEDGTAAPVINISPILRGYTITEAGKQRLKELAKEKQS